jgi:hypothetical protein
VILDQTIHGGNTPVPFVNNAALDEVKDSIQELRSILLRGRRGPYEEPYYGVEMDNGSRRSRQSGGFGPPSFEGPIIIPASQENPPTGITPILWQPNPGEQRPRQVVHLQSPRTSPIIIQAARSRSSSRDPYVVDSGISRHGRTDATGQELESVIDDFSSIVIIVGDFLSFLLFLTSQFRFIGHLPRLCIDRDARTRAQRIQQPRHTEIECQPSF